MTKLPHSLRRPLARALPIALAALLAGVPSALGGTGSQPRAHTAAHFLTGIGDEHSAMFHNTYYERLHTKIVRYIAPYDAALHTDSRNNAIGFIQGAEFHHEQVLVAFYHSEHSPTRLPTLSVYQRDVQRFIKLFPNVTEYQAWDEANRGNVAHAYSSPSASSAARYYQALERVCTGCAVIGLDVLDAENVGPTLTYISQFKQAVVRLRAPMPRIWGLHNYSDVNRFQSYRTRELVRKLGGEVWLTETGGIVQYGGAFPNYRGSGLTRAAKALKYMFAVAAAIPQIKRLYIYDWSGGNSRTRFDAGLTNNRARPRPGYVIVCRAMHAANCTHIRLAKN